MQVWTSGTRFATPRGVLAHAAPWRLAGLVTLLAIVLSPGGTAAQSPAAPQPAAAPEPSVDRLGRTTPRGTVAGFLAAARRGEDDLARQYLNTRLTGEAGATLAHQLFVVMDRRMGALPQPSDAPEGSRSHPDSPGLEIVGTVTSASGSIDVVLEQQPGEDDGLIWLFSRATLRAVPDVYAEIMLARDARRLPSELTSIRIGGILLIEWGIMLAGLAALYPLTKLLNRVLTAFIRRRRRDAFERSTFAARGVVSMPVRLLLLAIGCRVLLEMIPFSLLSRQFWATPSAMIAIIAAAWLAVLLNAEAERIFLRRVATNKAAATSLTRLVRRIVDLFVIFIAFIAVLRHFGIDPTPALAGLGVGGIAVALAAQKTLENVIAGASLIFDQAVQVGDVLKMDQVTGTVEYIGLRSTRIRTAERTLVSVPNSQIANTTIETLSARDKYWFHPVVSLGYETTPQQLQAVVGGIHAMLLEQAAIDAATVRVRFHRLAAFSLDLDVSAYVYARDWVHFLELQEPMLLAITRIVEQAGTALALPSQRMIVGGEGPAMAGEAARSPRPAPDAG
jgi:MscS family membrane protein